MQENTQVKINKEFNSFMQPSERRSQYFQNCRLEEFQYESE